MQVISWKLTSSSSWEYWHSLQRPQRWRVPGDQPRVAWTKEKIHLVNNKHFFHKDMWSDRMCQWSEKVSSKEEMESVQKKHSDHSMNKIIMAATKSSMGMEAGEQIGNC